MKIGYFICRGGKNKKDKVSEMPSEDEKLPRRLSAVQKPEGFTERRWKRKILCRTRSILLPTSSSSSTSSSCSSSSCFPSFLLPSFLTFAVRLTFVCLSGCVSCQPAHLGLETSSSLWLGHWSCRLVQRLPQEVISNSGTASICFSAFVFFFSLFFSHTQPVASPEKKTKKHKNRKEL